MTGIKYDTEKNRLDLIPPEFITALGEVLTHGAKKYDDNNWMRVEGGIDRYYGALLRHVMAWRSGERIDKDSGLSHLQCAIANLCFIFYLSEVMKKG
jgi:hypothetical protein